jgi:hypothetical protein
MFNMGGPIKQGIMQGIREPHQLGQIAGRVAPFASKVFGRVKGLFGKTRPEQVTIGQQIKRLPPTGGYSKGYPGPIRPGGWERGAPITETQNIFTPKPWAGAIGRYFKSSPEVAIGKKLIEGKGLITKPIKMGAKSPLLTAAGAYWAGDKWLWGDGKKVSDADIAKITGHEPFDHTDKKKIKKAQAAFAEAQRDTRVKKYLDMMGYDRSKKTAVADALIDASKIVSDRGTLETKNITRDLINPIIQATSKRFDKPEQIREAVGLMSVKAAITKDLEDPQVKKLRALQITDAEQKIAESASFEGGLSKFISDRKGKVDKVTLERIARLLANEHKEPFTLVEEDTDVTNLDNGIYMSGGKIIRVTEGVPQQIV